MDDRSLAKPDHLRGGPARAEWLAHNGAAVVALALGTVAFIVVATVSERIWSTPDWRLSVPGFAATAIAAIASLARREKAYPLALLGVGLAAAAMVLGWFLMLAIVIGATATVILILHSVL